MGTGQTPTSAANAPAEECSRRRRRNAVRLVRLRIHVIVSDRASHGGPSASNRRRGRLIAFAAIAAFLLILGFACRAGTAGRRLLHRLLPVHAQAAQVRTPRLRPAALDFSDRYGDGTPDFVRLADPADQAAFRRWFTLIAEYQAERPQAEMPAEITDCASLLRYSYREALKRHDEIWFETSGIEVAAPPGEIRAWSYPHSPLGTALFRVKPGAFSAEDLQRRRICAVCRRPRRSWSATRTS